MDKVMLPQVNAMPAPTWHRLDVNDTTLKIPALTMAHKVILQTSSNLDAKEGDFERALEQAEKRMRSHDKRRQREEDLNRAAQEDMEKPALSTYQEQSGQSEANESFLQAFKTGMGLQAFTYLRKVAKEVCTLKVPSGARESIEVRVCGVDGASSVAALDVVVEEGAQVSLVLGLDSPTEGFGMVATSLRLFAGKGAQVNIVCTQTLSDTWIGLDDTGMFLAEGAHVSVRHTVLGAQRAVVGLTSDLRGDLSHTCVDTRYLGHGKNTLDFNYEMRHHGLKTQSEMNANGVLCGASQKTLRGTIDFIRGCKGSCGREEETALLVDQRVQNRTVPVILCGEDDVAGNHGATIGHIRSNQLFYLASRGLSPEDSEQLFMRATLEEAAIIAPNDAAKEGVTRISEMLLSNSKEERV